MKRFFIALVFTATAANAAVAAPSPAKENRVPQQPQPRHFFIEEFTGLYCSYCPSAHTIAQNLQDVLGDRLQVVAVHTGNLATPHGNDPDMRCEAGAAWYAAIGSAGMPAGALNRTHYPECGRENSYELGRGQWAQVIRRLLSDTAKVNLYAEASFDEDTRTVSMEVEYYFPENVSGTHRLTLALIENHIRGPQLGASTGNQYLHQHVLRDVITEDFGDSIAGTAGQVHTLSYTYHLPDTFGNRIPEPSNLEVTAFITNPEGEVLNVTACHVEFENRYIAPSAQLRITGIGEKYNFCEIPVRILNLGTDTLRSVQLSVKWGSLNLQPQVDNLAIAYGKEQEVWFAIGDYELKDLTKYFISTLKVNGQDYVSNVVNGVTRLPYEVQTDSVRITVTPENTAGGRDLQWSVCLRNGEKVYEGSFENGPLQSKTLTLPVRPGTCYSVYIGDSWLDGQSGGYKVCDLNGTVLVHEQEMGFYGDAFSVYRIPELSTNEKPAKAEFGADFKVYAANRQVHVLNPSQKPIDRVRIYNVTGALLADRRVNTNGNVSVPLNRPTQPVIVSVESGPNAARFKVQIP